MSNHTLTLYRDNDRSGGRYGQFFYVERLDCTVVNRRNIDTYNRGVAWNSATAGAVACGAQFVDDTRLAVR